MSWRHFQVYRRGGEISGETDDDTQSGSATDVIATSEDDDNSSDGSDSDSDNSSSDGSHNMANSSSRRIPLEPLGNNFYTAVTECNQGTWNLFANKVNCHKLFSSCFGA